MRELRCRDVGFDCQHVMQGSSDEQVLAQAREHARDEHGIEQMHSDTEQKVRSFVHDA
jgi:predicted small metal-binding protein